MNISSVDANASIRGAVNFLNPPTNAQVQNSNSPDSIQSCCPIQSDFRGFLPYLIFQGICHYFNRFWYTLLYIYDSICYQLEAVPEPLFRNADVEQMQQTYWGLGSDKWKEAVDGVYHEHGKWVFDCGLHNHTIEPGYMLSVERAFHYISYHLNTRTNAAQYMQIHQLVCGHFDGENNSVLMGQEKVGVFRNIEDKNWWTPWTPWYGTFSAEAIAELDAQNPRVASYDLAANKLTYTSFTREEIHDLVERYFTEFYDEMDAASNNEDQKLRGIARLITRLEWLHPFKDGQGRTDSLLLNKLLVEFGFKPALLKHPYKSSTLGLNGWTDYLKQGMHNWEAGQILT